MHKRKMESLNIRNSLKTQSSKITIVELSKARPSEFTLVKLDIFSSNSPNQVITRLGEMSLSPNSTRLNRRRETTLDII